MGHGAARYRSALRGAQPCRVMTHHTKSLFSWIVTVQLEKLMMIQITQSASGSGIAALQDFWDFCKLWRV